MPVGGFVLNKMATMITKTTNKMATMISKNGIHDKVINK